MATASFAGSSMLIAFGSLAEPLARDQATYQIEGMTHMPLAQSKPTFGLLRPSALGILANLTARLFEYYWGERI